MTNLTEKTVTENNTLIIMSRSLIAAAVIGAVSLPVAAGKYRDQANYNNSAIDYARVINVEPVVETYKVNKPVEQCWDERVPVRHERHTRNHRNKSKTPEILGAILGGVIGNQVGKRGGGKARDVATVAGAVLGGSIGRDTKHHNSRRHNDRYDDRYDDRYERASYETVKRCEVRDSYITKEHVVGYDVEYKYRGNVFHTQMAERPGNKIKVNVTVNPV